MSIKTFRGRSSPKRPFRCGTLLGEGACKIGAYTIRKHRGFVALVDNCKDNLLKEERLLKRLEKHGIPTIENYGIHNIRVYKDGAPCFALVVRRMAASDRPECDRGIGTYEFRTFFGYLNENSLRDLKKIRTVVNKKRLYIGDFQMLIARNGDIRVTDPCSVRSKFKKHYIDEDVRWHLNRLIRMAEYKLKLVKAGKPLPERVCLSDYEGDREVA